MCEVCWRDKHAKVGRQKARRATGKKCNESSGFAEPLNRTSQGRLTVFCSSCFISSQMGGERSNQHRGHWCPTKETCDSSGSIRWITIVSLNERVSLVLLLESPNSAIFGISTSCSIATFELVLLLF